MSASPSGRIQIEGMRFWGKHGASQHEQEHAQPIDVDIEVSADLSVAARSDRLTDTVDYTQLFAACERAVTQNSFTLLEALAAHIARQACTDPRVEEVVVRVRKPRLFEGATPQVEIRMRRTASSEGQLGEVGETPGDGGE